MLKQKSFFPYNNIDSFQKFRETALPLREKWANSLQQYQLSITEDECKHAVAVFQAFKCQTIAEYCNPYLKRIFFSRLLLYFASARYSTRLINLTVVSTTQLQIYRVMPCSKFASQYLSFSQTGNSWT